MKRSAAVPLTLVTTLAAGAAAAACGERAQAMQCVDKTTERVVPDSLCVRAGVAPGGTAGAVAPTTGTGAVVHGGGFPVGPAFAWYYGGRVARGLVSGGSYAPAAGRSYRSGSGVVVGPSEARSRSGGFGGGFRGASPGRSGVSRGGFGAIGAGRVGGG